MDLTDQCLTSVQLQEYINEDINELKWKSMEDHLSGCELCARALENIEKAMDEDIFDKDKFNSFERAFNQELDSRVKSSKTSSSNYSLFKYAAIFLLLLNIGTLAYFQFGQPVSNESFTAYHFSQRGNIETQDALLDEALVAYESRSYEEALAILNRLPEDHEKLELILFLKGNAYAATDQHDDAIRAFEKMISNESWILYRPQVRKKLGILYSLSDKQMMINN